jgi:2-oxoisovalerate dehydrogenase E1 component
VLHNELKSVNILSDAEFETVETTVAQKMETALAFAFQSPEPMAEEAETDVYAPLKHTATDMAAEEILRQHVRTATGMRHITYAQALIEAMSEEMTRDPNVFILGEDVGLYGAYGATRELMQEFGEWRVLDTPISEATICGAAVGAAMAGMRPISEIMYVDFTPLAMDQIANQGAKNRYMFGGKTSVPMVVRT